MYLLSNRKNSGFFLNFLKGKLNANGPYTNKN